MSGVEAAGNKKRKRRGRAKREVTVDGLPAPWKAFYSTNRQRIFYFNAETKETTWEMPTVDHSKPESDLAGKATLKSSEKECRDGSIQTSKHEYLDCSYQRSISEPGEELMEVDEIGIEEISRDEEPMEIDLVVEEVHAFRREHFLYPDLISEDNAGAVVNATKYVEASETIRNTGTMLIIFDTSCLLQDALLLPLCIQRLHHVLIPYTVLRELDGLKKAHSKELRLKAVKTNAYLHDCTKRGCNYLHLENIFEASSGMEEFGCQNNDDIILKCAYVTTRKCKSEQMIVLFATSDKNLAVKAAAHDIITADRNDLLQLLTTDLPKSKAGEPATRNTVRKMLPSEFSFSLTAKSSSSAVENVGSDMPGKFANCSPVPHSHHLSSSPLEVRKEEGLPFGSAASSSAVSDRFQSRFCDSMRRKKGNNGKTLGTVELREFQQQQSASCSVQKASVKNAGFNRFGKKRKLSELSGYCMDDFLEIFANLLHYILQHRNETKSIEDIRRLNKVIDSVITDESFSLSVLIDMVSRFYDFYANRDVFKSATHFDKKQLAKEYDETASEVKEKLRKFQKQLIDI